MVSNNIAMLFCGSIIMSSKYSDDINLPHLDHEARREPIIRRFSRRTNVREREMRDVHFEKR